MNGDDAVNVIDSQIVAARMNRVDLPTGDIDKDGIVSVFDLQLVAMNATGRGCGTSRWAVGLPLDESPGLRPIERNCAQRVLAL